MFFSKAFEKSRNRFSTAKSGFNPLAVFVFKVMGAAVISIYSVDFLKEKDSNPIL